MRKLLQTVDVEMCITFFKKGMASLIILSMLMSDVVNAMEEEHEPLLIQRAHSPKFPTTDREVPIESIEDFFSKRDSSSDEVDSSTGSLSTSPEKSTPESDKSLATSPVVDLSLILSQSNVASPPQPLEIPQSISKSHVPDFILSPANLDHSEGSDSENDSTYSEPTTESFKPSAAGAKSLGSIDHGILLTVEEDYPQLSGNWRGGSIRMAGSLQERSPSLIQRSKSVAESSHNNGKSTIPVPGLTLPPILESDSEADSLGETDVIPKNPFLENQQKSKRRPTSAPTSFSRKAPLDENSRLLQDEDVSRRYSIQEGSDAPPPGQYCGFVLMEVEEDEKEDYSKCCSNRPLLPQPTKYTLRGATTLDAALNKVRKRSKLLTAHPSDNHSVSSNDSSDSLSSEESDPSSPDGSPSKAVRRDRVLLPLDEDFEVENPPLPILDLQSGIEGSHVFPVPLPLPVNHDLEEGGGLPTAPLVGSLFSPQEAWKSFLADLKELPTKTKTQLVNFTHQILNGKSTWPQRLGKWVIGPVIGGGFAYMMAPVYDGGIGYLSTQGAILQDFIQSNFLQDTLLYIMISAVPDGVSRNAHLWKKGIGYLFRQGKEIGRMCAAGGISFFTAVIPPVYLINAEEYAIKNFGLHGFNNVFARTMLVGIPFLYLDAFASDFNTAWTAFPEIKEWFGKLFCRRSLRAQLPVFLDGPRERFDNNLNSLEHFLYRAPQAVIDEIYDNVTQVKEGAQVPFCENYDEALASQQTFAVLSYLLSIGDDVVQGASKPKSIYDISAEIFKYACLILGTPARALALQYIGYSIFELLFQDPTAQVLGGIFALLAFLPQTFMEDQGMDNFFKRFLVTEDPHGHGAHPIYRALIKLYCILQGLLYTFPLTVLTLQAFQQWFGEGWWPLIAGIPFFIPEAAAQIYSFGGTYNQLVATSVTNVHNTKIRKYLGKEPVSDWKRDWLIRFVQESRGELKHWHPDLIQKLTEGIAVFQKAD